MKIVTWNVNSVRARAAHVTDLVCDDKPNVLCLQETKVENSSFPHDLFQSHSSVVNGQKSYNGVSIHTRKPHKENQCDPFCSESGCRVVSVTYKGIRIVNVYVPNGGSSEKAYREKLVWLEKFRKYLKRQLKKYKYLVVVGDFNVCPVGEDTWNPDLWNGRVTCTVPEREWYAKLLKLGLVDSYLHHNSAHDFTWYNYRANGYKRGHGLRLDHILVSPSLVPHIHDVRVLYEYRGLEKPSDHVPVLLDIRK